MGGAASARRPLHAGAARRNRSVACSVLSRSGGGGSTTSGVVGGWLGPGTSAAGSASIVIRPDRPDTMFAGSAGGGIWRTTNGGATWAPVDDFMPVLSVSSLVINPANPAVMFAGTGRALKATPSPAPAFSGAWMAAPRGRSCRPRRARRPSALSTGSRYRRTDGRCSRPPATGHSAARTAARRSRSSPRASPRRTLTFTRPTAPERLRPGTARSCTLRMAASPGGRPPHAARRGRVEIAYARSQPDVVYASVDAGGEPGNRSGNAGATFTAVSAGKLPDGQGWDDNALWVDPVDGNHVIVGGVSRRDARWRRDVPAIRRLHTRRSSRDRVRPAL